MVVVTGSGLLGGCLAEIIDEEHDASAMVCSMRVVGLLDHGCVIGGDGGAGWRVSMLSVHGCRCRWTYRGYLSRVTGSVSVWPLTIAMKPTMAERSAKSFMIKTVGCDVLFVSCCWKQNRKYREVVAKEVANCQSGSIGGRIFFFYTRRRREVTNGRLWRTLFVAGARSTVIDCLRFQVARYCGAHVIVMATNLHV